MMNSIPCKNCVVFPICKMIKHEDKSLYPNFFISKLQDRCPIINVYLSDSFAEQYPGDYNIHDLLNLSNAEKELLRTFGWEEIEE